jgi:hypothetical protein
MIETQGSYLGRYQAGDMVPLRLWCINRATDSPARPDRAPWFTVSRLGDGLVDVRGPHADGGLLRDHGAVLHQASPRRQLHAWNLPRWCIVTSSRAASTAIRDQFQVMPGSDASGTVISLFYYRHPETGYVLAQLTERRARARPEPQGLTMN